MRTIAAVARQSHGPFSIEQIEVGDPAPDELLVRIVGVGLCHTDLIFRDQFAPYPLPAVLGHEGAGTVEAVGSAVTGFAPGDAVVLGFSSCGVCPLCQNHLPSYCEQFPPLNYAGMRLTDGSTAYSTADERVASHFFGQSSFTGLAIVRACNAVKVDTGASDLALFGSLGCGFQTGAGGIMRSLACHPGSGVAIAGGGPVGLAAVMGAVVQGCATVILIEPLAARRGLALELGATHVIDPLAGNVTEAIRAIAPRGTDFAFDTSGRIAVIEAMLAALAPRGTLGLVGVPPEPTDALTLNLAVAITYGQRVVGIMEGDSDPQDFIPELVRLNAAGQFPFEKLIRTFSLAEINSAIAAQTKGECVKAVLLP